MGYKHDQRLPSEIHEELLLAQQEESQPPPPPYFGPGSSTSGLRPPLSGLAAGDERTNSRESLIPETDPSDGRRVLLLIYIHGFIGNETSFSSFPAHVHSTLTPRVANTHVVHTKVYPRYKTRNNVQVVRDKLSEWLEPHESPKRDIVLVGHSMGGILAAEVALMTSPSHPGTPHHRLLGTLNLDVPFLGMHPRIIGAGLSSLFAGSPEQQKAASTAGETGHDMALLPVPTSDSFTPTLSPQSSGPSLALPNDQNYNPSFVNDSRVPTRKALDNIFHFVNKHSDSLLKAGKAYVTSHLEFGGTMADYKTLDRRYSQLRALEKDPTNVRFVNFFSTCTGRPKPPKKVKSNSAPTAEKVDQSESLESLTKASSTGTISETLVSADSPPPEDFDGADEADGIKKLTLTNTDPIPMTDSEGDKNSDSDTETDSDISFHDAQEGAEVPGALSSSSLETPVSHSADLTDLSLPPIPDEPTNPPPFDPSVYADKGAFKLAEKQHARLQKAYQQASKDRERAIKERERLLAKRKKEQLRMEEKREKEEQRKLKLEEKEKGMGKGKGKGKEKEQLTSHEESEKLRLELEAERMEQERIKLEGKIPSTRSPTTLSSDAGDAPPDGKQEFREKKAREMEEKQRLKTEKAQRQKEEKEQKQWKAKQLKEQKAREKEAKREAKQKQKQEALPDEVDLDGSKNNEIEGAQCKEEDIGPEKAKKLRTFCLVPPKATTGRRKDWVPVFVADVDQVGAHCGLFKADKPHYGPFVEMVVERLVDWVEDAGGAIAL